MRRLNEKGYALLITVGFTFVAMVAGLAFLKMGDLESPLVADAESWTQALDTSEAAANAAAEMVRASRLVSSDDCKEEYNPFEPRDVRPPASEGGPPEPDWHDECNGPAWVDKSAETAFAPGGRHHGLYRASVQGVQNRARLDDPNYTGDSDVEPYGGRPSLDAYDHNTKFFLSTVGDHPDPSRQRSNHRRRVVTFVGLPAGFGLDRVEVAGVGISIPLTCALTVQNPAPIDPPAITVPPVSASATVSASVYHGQSGAKLEANGNVSWSGTTYDPPAIPAEITSCSAAAGLIGALPQRLDLAVPPTLVDQGASLFDFAASILGSPESRSEGTLPVLPAGLFNSDDTVNEWYFTGRAPADSPGIAMYDAGGGSVTFLPPRLGDVGNYPGEALGRVAMDGGDLGGTYLPRGNVVVVKNGDAQIRGSWLDLEQRWGPLADSAGIVRPLDIVIAADRDIYVDDATDLLYHVQTGQNTRLVLIAGRDIVFTGDLFLTDLSVVALARRDIVLRQRTETLGGGVPDANASIATAPLIVTSALKLGELMSSLRGALVAGRNLVKTLGWRVKFDPDVLNGSMSMRPEPELPVASFDGGIDGFAANEDPRLVWKVGDTEDLDGSPDSIIGTDSDDLVIEVEAGEAAKAPNTLPLIGPVTVKTSHPLTGEQMLAPVEGTPGVTIPGGVCTTASITLACVPLGGQCLPGTGTTQQRKICSPRDVSSYNRFVRFRVYGDIFYQIPVSGGSTLYNPFITGIGGIEGDVPLQKNGSQGETVVKSWITPQDWSSFDYIAFWYSSDLPDLMVDQAELAYSGVVLPPLLATELPAASFVIEDVLGQRLVFPLEATGGKVLKLDLRRHFLYEGPGPTPMLPAMHPYGFAGVTLEAISRVFVRVNHPGPGGTIRLRGIRLPGNAGALHNLPFPFRYEFYNWQTMAAN